MKLREGDVVVFIKNIDFSLKKGDIGLIDAISEGDICVIDLSKHPSCTHVWVRISEGYGSTFPATTTYLSKRIKVIGRI